MSGAVIRVELEGLVELLQRRTKRLGLFGRRVGVVGAEEAEQRAREILEHWHERRESHTGVGGGVHHHVRAVAIDGRVQIEAARCQHRLTTTRAVADHGDLGIGRRQRSQIRRRGANVADESLVGHAAQRSRGGRRVIGAGPGRFAAVEVDADGVVPIGRESTGDLLGRLVVARQVVDDDDTADGPIDDGLGEVRLDDVIRVTFEIDGLGSKIECHLSTLSSGGD